MIYTFYSYKGGVGRSMALANVAEWFYRQGLRVIMIDWDLEAPGLENFFYSSETELDIVRSQLGLIDLLLSYKRIWPRLRLPSTQDASAQQNVEAKEHTPDNLQILRETLPPISDVLYPIHAPETNDGKDAALWLIPAGWRSGDRFPVYAQAVQSFDWTDFYNSFDGETYFNWMREQLVAETLADIVLIDSRTGVTEMGGVCTRQMADVVVSFCVPNMQNLGGVQTMAKSFARSEIIEKRGRELDLVLVPTRIDMNELDYRKAFEDQFHQRLDKFTPPTFQAVKAGFWDLQIQYVAKYAYSEKLAINDSSAPELSGAYRKLAAHLALLAGGKSGLQIRSKMADELQNEFKDRLPSVFISFVGEDGGRIAKELRERLAQQRVALWPDLSEVKIKGDVWQEITGVLDQVKALVLIMTPEAMRSELVRKEWRYARQQGVSVYLVAKNAHAFADASGASKTVPSYNANGTTTLSGADDSTIRPRWLRSENYYDADTEWENLASLLQRPVLTTRVPFMAPDLLEGYVERPEILKELKDALLFEEAHRDGEAATANTVALWGPAGCGKTTAAVGFCQDEDVNSFFEDGIMWVTLGENPNMLGELTKLYAALTGERPPFVDEEEAAKALSSKLSGKHCLLVVTDVLSVEQLRFFTPPGGSRCARLITTRDINIAFGSSARLIPVREMSESEALQLIGVQLDAGREDQAIIEDLTKHLGNWPLALRLANAELRKRAKLGNNDLNSALKSLTQDYEERGTIVLDRSGVVGSKGTISQTLESAIALALPVKEDRERYIQLAFFPQNAEITLKEVSDLWGLDEAETEKRIQHLRDVALLAYEPTQKIIRLQSVMRSYILSKMPDQDGLNDKLEAAFSHFSTVRQEAARRVLTRLVRLKAQDEEGDDTRQRVKVSDLDTSSQMAVESLAEAKLVSIEQDSTTGAPVVQIANEAYLKGWKRLRKWIEDDREFLLWRQQLRLKIAEWEETKRDQGALLSGVPLEVATRWREQRRDELNEAETLYIDESLLETERLKQAQQQVKVAQRQTWLGAAATIIFIVAILTTLGIFQYRQMHGEDEKRKKQEEAVHISQIRAESYTNAGLQDVFNHNYEDALHDYTQAIEIRPDYADAYFHRAYVYRDTGHLDQAIADYTQAIKNKPEYAEAYFERANVYSRNVDDNKAIEDYTTAIKLKPDYWNAYLNRGFTYESNGKFDEAINDYNQIISSSSDQFKANAYLRRGSAYLSMKDRDRAAADFQKAIELTADPAIRDPASIALKSLGYKQQQQQEASASPVAPNIFLEYNDAKDGPVLDAIAASLRSNGFRVQPKDVSGGRTNGDVRYYYPEDKANAEKIRSIVATTLNNQSTNRSSVKLNINLIYLGDRYTYVPRGNIEVWIPQLQKPVQQIQQQTLELESKPKYKS